MYESKDCDTLQYSVNEFCNLIQSKSQIWIWVVLMCNTIFFYSD